MNKQPLISIAIPFYNEEKFLGESIKSLLNQTYRDITIILSDNCSTDASYSIAQSFAAADNRIKLIKHESNIGAVPNFTFTRDFATTKYFMWLGAHDLINENFIEEAINFLENNHDSVLFFPKACYFEEYGSWLEDADSEIESNSTHPQERMMRVVTKLDKCTAVHGVFKLNTLKQIPFDNKGVDSLLLFLTAYHGVIQSSKCTSYYRRIVRKETQEEFIKRMKEFKIGNADNVETYRDGVYMVYFKYLNQLSGFNFIEKLNLILKLKDLFAYRYGKAFSWTQIFSYFIKVDFRLQVLFLLFSAMIFNITKSLKRKVGIS
jgi:glycosyltransferase involved in cell wall biosynthesis